MKYLLCDCDGVLLDWEEGFRHWIYDHHEIRLDPAGPQSWDLAEWVGSPSEHCRKLVEQFNATAHFGHLHPIMGAKIALQQARDRGYQVVVITACSDDPKIIAMREANLHSEFFGLISEIHCVPLGGDKKPVLARYPRPSIWVEDNPKHALDGARIGHEAFCLRRSHNRSQEPASRHDNEVRWVSNWRAILSLLD